MIVSAVTPGRRRAAVAGDASCRPGSPTASSPSHTGHARRRVDRRERDAGRSRGRSGRPSRSRRGCRPARRARRWTGSSRVVGVAARTAATVGRLRAVRRRRRCPWWWPPRRRRRPAPPRGRPDRSAAPGRGPARAGAAVRSSVSSSGRSSERCERSSARRSPRYGGHHLRGGRGPRRAGPLAITRALVEGDEPVGDRRHRAMSCSMTSSDAPSRSRRPSSTGPRASASRWAMPLLGSSSRTTDGLVGDDARQVDHAARAGGQLAEPLVERNAARPNSSISSSTRSATAASVSCDGREAAAPRSSGSPPGSTARARPRWSRRR